MTDNKETQLHDFEEQLGLEFEHKPLLIQAMTHRSYVNEREEVTKDNERLEFLGDAILDYIVADLLYRRFPEEPEGELTQLRSALVRADSLAELAQDCRLGEYLLMGHGEELNGGRQRTNNLCRGFEALIGAIYMDQGLGAVRAFVVPRLELRLEYILAHNLHRDARSMLQERSQAELRFTPVYRLVDANGPDHEREFYIEVVVGDIVLGRGTGSSKRAAAQAAARDAMQRLENQGWPTEADTIVVDHLPLTDSDPNLAAGSTSSPDLGENSQ